MYCTLHFIKHCPLCPGWWAPGQGSVALQPASRGQALWSRDTPLQMRPGAGCVALSKTHICRPGHSFFQQWPNDLKRLCDAGYLPSPLWAPAARLCRRGGVPKRDPKRSPCVEILLPSALWPVGPQVSPSAERRFLFQCPSPQSVLYKLFPTWATACKRLEGGAQAILSILSISQRRPSPPTQEQKSQGHRMTLILP